MDKAINLALVGASGVVGQKIISILEKRNIKIDSFYPLGSSSVGQEVILNNENYKIESLSDFDCKKKRSCNIFSRLKGC